MICLLADLAFKVSLTSLGELNRRPEPSLTEGGVNGEKSVRQPTSPSCSVGKSLILNMLAEDY